MCICRSRWGTDQFSFAASTSCCHAASVMDPRTACLMVIGLVFPNAEGGRRSADSPFGRVGPREARRGRWHQSLKDAGIERRLTPHSLRHGCATDFLTGARGSRLEAWQVQVLHGHEQITTTLKYLHAGEKDLFAALHQSQNSPSPYVSASRKPLRNKALEPHQGGMAEETGFEPVEPFRAQWFSRPPP